MFVIRRMCFKGNRRVLLLVMLVISLLIINNGTKKSASTNVRSDIGIESALRTKLYSMDLETKVGSFYKHRLRLWYEGRCIDATDEGKLVVQFCDPNKQQAFSLTKDNQLVYERLGKCVEIGTNHGTEEFSLSLVECRMVTGAFIITDNEVVLLTRILDDKELCLSPVSLLKEKDVTYSPCLNDPVRLTPCDKVASRLVLIAEELFLEDRKLLKEAVIPPGSSCDFAACGFNRREPVNLLPQIKRCTKLWECVTLVVKTARRPQLVLLQAKSVREKLGFDLPTVVYDDGPDDYSAETRRQIAEYPLMRYIVSNDEDLGIARGRDLALLEIKTEYFFLLDDDVQFTEETNISKLVEILDTTDATIASGRYDRKVEFAAFLEFGYFHKINNNPEIGMFNGVCSKVNQTIPNFPSCVRCDTSSNVFLARTQQIIDIGGWDPDLAIIEHKDLFIRLKAAGMKLVYCKDVKLKHDRPKDKHDPGEGYLEKRRRSIPRYKFLLWNAWNVQNIFENNRPEIVKINDAGEITYPQLSGQGGGHC